MNEFDESIKKARDDYRLAESVAEKQGMDGADKHKFISNYLLERLAIAYGGAG